MLSPSNMGDDRGPKFRFYKTALPMLQHIALVYQDRHRIEHFRRVNTGWSVETLDFATPIEHFRKLLAGLAG